MIKRTAPLVRLLAGLCLSLAGHPHAQAAAGQAPPAAESGIDGLFARFASPDRPGCSVAAARAGETLVERAFGLANLEHAVANTTATVFEAGSASKQFTAAAILLLAQDGKLALGDDVRKYLPELPDYGDTITLDHLLTHTSGLRDWRAVVAVEGWPLGTRVHGNSDALHVASRQRRLNHRPGHEYAYTNTGYSLAALIVERVSGKSLAAFSAERLFDPLGMRSTQWRDDFTRVVTGRATAYARQGSAFVQQMPFENAYGAGGLLTTPHDLTIWNHALDRGRLGPLVTARLQEQAVLNDGTRAIYGRGLMVERYRGATEIGHGGVTGAYVGFVARYPEHRLSVSVLCNGPADARDLAHAIADRFLPKDSPAPVPDPAADAARTGSAAPAPIRAPGSRWRPDAAELATFAGRYGSDEAGAAFLLSVEDGGLAMRLERRPDEVRRLAPTVRDTFVFVGGKLRFRRGGSGAPERLELSVLRLRNLEFVRDPAVPVAR
jgi:CubicO group peptidase (beta-lactamase class C family)